MILVLDYGRGNLFSLGEALRHLGADYRISGDPAALAQAERIVFPGVGAFGDAMDGLRKRGLVAPLQQAAARGVPILGICVGCQLMLDRGEEFGAHAGLGLIPGAVARLPAPRSGDPDAIRIPNVGWRRLEVRPGAPVLDTLAPGTMMYFVHSYAPMVADPAHVAATIDVNGTAIPVAIHRGNLVGVQFHPEKSGPAGLALIGRFLAADFSPARTEVEQEA
ncbi:MAG: imidazole glycerol phosphate synthase subunit HisH [Alphaproteobacteria bacterium]